MKKNLLLFFAIFFVFIYAKAEPSQNYKFVSVDVLFARYKNDYERVSKTGFYLSDCLYLDVGFINRIRREFPLYIKQKGIKISMYKRGKQDQYNVKLKGNYLSVKDVIKSYAPELLELMRDPVSLTVNYYIFKFRKSFTPHPVRDLDLSVLQ